MQVGLRLTFPSAVLVGALVLASSCRIENPAFLAIGDSGSSTEGAPKTAPDGPGPEAAPGDTQGEPSGSDPEGTNDAGSGESNPDPDSDGESAGEDVDEAATKAYCDAAALCFPIHDLMPRGSITDLGPSSLAINFAEPVSTVAVEGQTAPLNRAIQLAPSSAGVSSAPLDLNGSSEIAFDIWFTPDDARSVDWTLFELEGFLAVERMDTGGIRCAIRGRILPLGPATAPDFSTNQTLHHVACGIKDGQAFMWWDGRPVLDVIPSGPKSPTKAQIRLGQGPEKSAREPFVGRVAGIRVWSDVETMRVRNNLPQPLNAGVRP